MSMIIVYGDIQSGNCYKIALLFSQLGIAHDWKPVYVLNGDTKTTEFLTMNPAGQIPVVKLDDGEVLTQSNAILNFFAEGSALMPQLIWTEPVYRSGSFLNSTIMSPP